MIVSKIFPFSRFCLRIVFWKGLWSVVYASGRTHRRYCSCSVLLWERTDWENCFNYSSGLLEDLWLLAGVDQCQQWAGQHRLPTVLRRFLRVYLNNLIRLSERNNTPPIGGLSPELDWTEYWRILRPTAGNEKTSVHALRENISQVIKGKIKPLFVGSTWEINKHTSNPYWNKWVNKITAEWVVLEYKAQLWTWHDPDVFLCKKQLYLAWGMIVSAMSVTTYKVFLLNVLSCQSCWSLRYLLIS